MASILIVDDNIGIRRVLELVLSSEGHQVTEAENGREALAYLQKNTPDLIVLDVNMPGISGIEVCERVKHVSRLKHTPVLILTSLQDEQTKRLAKLAKAEFMMSKPLSGKGIRGTVARLLSAATETEVSIC